MDDFTAENDEQLIHLVSGHQELYDPQNAAYKLTVKKNVTWKSIAENINKDVEACKKRWKNLRDNYYKQKKKETQTTGSAGPGKRRRNSLLDQLGFLEAIKHERRLLTNNNVEIDHSHQEHSSDNTDDDSMKDIDTNTPNAVSQNLPTPNVVNTSSTNYVKNGKWKNEKRKKNVSTDILKALNQSSSEREILMKQITAAPLAPPEDEIDALFKSLAITVKKFPPLLIAETKSKIFQIISNAEIQLLRSQNSTSRLSTYSYDDSSTPLPSPYTWDQQDAPSGSGVAQYFGSFQTE